MQESISGIIDLLVADPSREALIGTLEERSHACSTEDANLIRRYIEFETRKPSTFTVESVLACNLRCPECAIGGGLTTRKRKILGLDEFETMFAKVKDWTRYAYLHLWGEPFLNKEILTMTRIASATSKVNLSTNALLIREEQVPDIIASGVADMIVSIDGATQEIYEQYRVGGKVDEAFRSLRWLVEENRRQGRPVNIQAQFIVFGHNQHEMDLFRGRCEEIGVPVAFKAPYLRGSKSRFRAPTLPEFQRKTYDTAEELRTAISGCVNPPDVLTVDVQGNVVLCCHDYDGEVNFGNLLKSDFDEIWNHPRYRQTRWNIATGRPPRFCETKCMTYFPTSEYPVQGIETPPAPAPAPTPEQGVRINLCGGSVSLPGWTNVDLVAGADVRVDLESAPLPWKDGSVEAIAFISAVNYFTRDRALEILAECRRVLRPGGVLRVGVQDLRILVRNYQLGDAGFLDEKLPDGRDRFPGETYADKFCNWFYGFEVEGKSCRYAYDFDSLAGLARRAGFSTVVERAFRTGDLPDVASLDNRPEQMFFLEARKEAEAVDAFATGMELWRAGRHEEGWQVLLEPVRDGRLEEKDLETFLGIVAERSTEPETLKILEHISVRHPSPALTAKMRSARESLDSKNASPRFDVARAEPAASATPKPSDQTQLDAALRWLLRSEEATGRKGSSAYHDYRLDSWGPAYPETTGYIVPTLLRASDRLARPELAETAVRMGDWLCSIQERGGGLGEAVGSFATHPRVFNSGQAMLGWIALHQAGYGDRFLESAQRCGDWLVGLQDPDGKWSRSTYAGPKPYHARVGWALLELFALTSDRKHLDASTRHLHWTLSRAFPNGCFQGNSLDQEDRPWTHLIGYVLFGLVEQVRLHKLLGVGIDARVLETLVSAGDHLVRCHEIASAKGLRGLAATYDMEWRSADAWSCVTGNAQIAHFLTKLSHRTAEPRFEAAAQRLLADVADAQFLDPSLPPDMLGGLPGSLPHGGPYLPHRIPNWGVKFFADALLEAMHPTSKSTLIG